MHHQHDFRHSAVQQLFTRVRSLRHRAARDSSRTFLIDGVRQFVQACDAQYAFDSIVHCPLLLRNDLAEMLVRRLAAFGVRRVEVSPKQFRAMSDAEHASGIAGIVRQRWISLGKASPKRGLCWLVVEMIRSPGNLGTILRTAEATGAAGAIFLGDACDPFDPAVVRASMGGIFHLQLVRASCEEFRRWAKLGGVQTIGLSPRSEFLWMNFPTRASDDGCAAPIAILIGEERAGISAEAGSLCDVTVRLPMVGRADSLNVSVATGVMLYDLVRRTLGG